MTTMPTKPTPPKATPLAPAAAATNPFEDRNHNGYFDGADVLPTFRAQSQKGFERTASETGEGVFEMMGARVVKMAMRMMKRDNQPLPPEAMDIVATEFNDKITSVANDPRMGDAKYREAFIIALGINARAQGISPDQTEITLADARSFMEFAATFKTKFPKGAKLEAKDMNAILDFFDGIPVNLPPLPAVPRGNGKPEKSI